MLFKGNQDVDNGNEKEDPDDRSPNAHLAGIGVNAERASGGSLLDVEVGGTGGGTGGAREGKAIFTEVALSGDLVTIFAVGVETGDV